MMYYSCVKNIRPTNLLIYLKLMKFSNTFITTKQPVLLPAVYNDWAGATAE